MMVDLTHRVALVTGGGRGIGRGIALALARQGARVAVADIDQRSASAVARELKTPGRLSLGLEMDVASNSSVTQGLLNVQSQLGPVEILVNNAGVIGAPGWSGGSTDEDWEHTFAVNVRGVVICSEAVLPLMMERRYGKIINTASVAGRIARPIYPHYSASKAAVINYTKSLAAKVAPYSINVNAVCPGPLATDMFNTIARVRSQINPAESSLNAQEIYRRDIEARVPLNREITPEDIGNMVAFLASEDARNITGQSIHVDGGQVMV
jgi:NAD(P)-dependent dehydrogenase (short-subunit alcohol dehydrogenase family)